jgi:uncharacterized protein with ParB-like and HNH nuclease domain
MRIIDSLFHNFYIPPVIFAITQDEDGEEIRICVDGKQRLTSIVRFLNGLVRFQTFHRSRFGRNSFASLLQVACV